MDGNDVETECHVKHSGPLAHVVSGPEAPERPCVLVSAGLVSGFPVDWAL